MKTKSLVCQLLSIETTKINIRILPSPRLPHHFSNNLFLTPRPSISIPIFITSNPLQFITMNLTSIKSWKTF